ncbi:jg22269 [Pararge aegeria aegeria]|uniref:Jg22269 protein n=1 Tax=Pararge aegeria aegeria TaxID=348720 RepID=A0A8S4QP18_9NEOP|nr:jg22269 [Pararge aegeria aegeria]
MSRMVAVIMECRVSQQDSSGAKSDRDSRLSTLGDRLAHQRLMAAHTPSTMSPMIHGSTCHAVAVEPGSF